ncbi:oxidoreductase [Inquilinus limosus]|uniref:Oxidoreductase n=1 Tax=Inquilinus limosus TaxID=171674 RepID=A0A211Z1D0_9PROT|nr:oxidoreductase [Inquilinus limosus]OWJ59069.1 oxidoreductase [Inquilinus limosus]
MTASALFSPLALGPITLPNRLVIAPMCQYSADDGCASDWHIQHWMTLAMSGAALVVVEATGVERRGRITHGCLGLYSDANERSIARALAAARAVALPGTRFGVQLAHAGRKASTQRPWEGGRPLSPDQDPWPTVGPSAVPFDANWHTPEALDETGLERVKAAFVAAARRAVRLGFDAIELHMAHGYLFHSFLSPLSNRRDDRWGGDAERRRAFPLAVAAAVREVVPAGIALGIRVSASEWVEGGFEVGEAAVLATELKALGYTFICASSGGNAAHARIPVGPGYQVPLAREIREKSGLTTRAVGMIVDPHQAEGIITRGDADQVALARAVLDDPRWGWHAAEALGAELTLPPQYARAGARTWPGRKLLQAAE